MKRNSSYFWQSFFFVLAVILTLIGLSVFSRPAPAAEKPLPPRYLVGVALYDDSGSLVKVMLGKEMFLSLDTCRDDMRKTVEKPTAEGKKVIGFCLPIPTLNAADLQPPDGV